MINGILKILQSAQTVTAYVPAGRILPLVQVQGDEFPAILVDLEGTRPNDSKSSTSRIDVNDVAVVVVSESAKNAYQIAQACRTVLDGFSGPSDDVQIAECRFINWSTDADDGGRLFILSSAYTVATYVDGSTAIVQGTAPAPALVVQELDGDPIVSANKLIVPNGSLSVSGTNAILTYTSAATVLLAAASMSTATGNIGSTNVTLPIDTLDFSTGQGFSVVSNSFRGPTGSNVVNVHVVFSATTNDELPHVVLLQNGSQIAEGTGYITGQHGDTHTSVTITASVDAGARLTLQARNEANGNDEIQCESATIQLITSIE